MWFGVVSIFPEMFSVIQNYGISKRAINNNLVKLNIYNPRSYALDNRATVDDKPYGGGAGMVMKVEPLLSAIRAAQQDRSDLLGVGDQKKLLVVLLSPQGKKIVQKDLRDLIKSYDSIVFVCGRYEGIDERINSLAIDEEWSIGDFILSGGELAAMAFIDAIIRLVPGALGDPESLNADSFGEDGLLDYPHYTKPKSIYGLTVPDILLSGDHLKIANWRQQQRLIRTKQRRKDLLLGGKQNDKQ